MIADRMKKGAALSLILALTACAQTSYGPYGAGGSDDSMIEMERRVEFEVTGAFYRDPPSCVVILPFADGTGRATTRGRMAEESVARQISAKIDRVVWPRTRDRLLRDGAMDLSNQRDRKAFASQARCGHIVEISPYGGESMFALVWTQERVGLEIRMRRAADGELVWQARHSATRSEGGLPFSPFSAAFNALSVGRFKADTDVPVSLLDDAARRIVKTLPDTRAYGLAETHPKTWRKGLSKSQRWLE
ncbi:MAG: hypothetical protein MI741_20240 [Rhodospirillales bacterium]|nr:hypothetical protein [Rhodospirillales bacterium]